MLSRPHPCLGWLYVNPGDTRRLFDRLCSFRDAELEKDPTFSGMPQAFSDWTWHTWLPANLHRYEKQVRDHIHYLDLKLVRITTLQAPITKALVVLSMPSVWR